MCRAGNHSPLIFWRILNQSDIVTKLSPKLFVRVQHIAELESALTVEAAGHMYDLVSIGNPVCGAIGQGSPHPGSNVLVALYVRAVPINNLLLYVTR